MSKSPGLLVIARPSGQSLSRFAHAGQVVNNGNCAPFARLHTLSRHERQIECRAEIRPSGMLSLDRRAPSGDCNLRRRFESSAPAESSRQVTACGAFIGAHAGKESGGGASIPLPVPLRLGSYATADARSSSRNGGPSARPRASRFSRQTWPSATSFRAASAASAIVRYGPDIGAWVTASAITNPAAESQMTTSPALGFDIAQIDTTNRRRHSTTSVTWRRQPAGVAQRLCLALGLLAGVGLSCAPPIELRPAQLVIDQDAQLVTVRPFVTRA